MNLVKPCLLAVALLGVSSAASAATATANMTVQLTVVNDCSIAAIPTLNFGSVTGSIATPINTLTTTLTVKCNGSVPYHVGLGNGNNYSGGSRRMKHSTDAQFVNYGLYTDTARTSNFGATAAGGTANDVDMTGTGSDQTITVYGLVPATQNVPGGSYSDTVLATMEY
ncbi:MAG: spore coat U domain-containing protein [Moraxellaceae bacterium]|nr:spore coat U domain-containing protein [Moraxellaceae bacterium]